MLEPAEETEDLGALVRASRGGDEAAQNRLFTVLHAEIATVAAVLRRREWRQPSLATGDLVNEAVVRMLRSPMSEAADILHLRALAARVIKQVLIDAARRRNAEKRRHFDVRLTDIDDAVPGEAVELQALETALVRLRNIDELSAEIVTLRYFGGFSTDEIASTLGTSESSVRRKWRTARTWLKRVVTEDARLA